MDEPKKKRIGRVWTDEERAKLSESMKGKKTGPRGPLSPEHKAAIRAGLKAANWKWSDEARKKMSEARKGKPGKKCTEEQRKKISESIKKAWETRKANGTDKKQPLTDEHKKKVSEGIRKAWETRKANGTYSGDPERREERLAKKQKAAENKAAGINGRKRKRTPEEIAKMVAGRKGFKHTDESKRKLSEAAKRTRAEQKQAKGLEPPKPYIPKPIVVTTYEFGETGRTKAPPKRY